MIYSHSFLHLSCKRFTEIPSGLHLEQCIFPIVFINAMWPQHWVFAFKTKGFEVLRSSTKHCPACLPMVFCLTDLASYLVSYISSFAVSAFICLARKTVLSPTGLPIPWVWSTSLWAQSGTPHFHNFHSPPPVIRTPSFHLLQFFSQNAARCTQDEEYSWICPH